MTEDEKENLWLVLKRFAHEINSDRFMLIEYISPVVDGCRAALNVSIEKAQVLHSLSDLEVDEYLDTNEMSMMNLTICFHTLDTDEIGSLVFDEGEVYAYDECVEPDLKISGNQDIIFQLLDADAKISASETLGKDYFIEGKDASNVIEGLGLLCYPPLLKIARAGIDPSSLLSDDADAVILAAASELVTEIVKAWITISIKKNLPNNDS